MTSEQQLNAKHLYFQTDLSKTQIAATLNIPRRTLHYWIREKNWDRLKQSAAHMPSLLAEKCYHLIARFTDQLLAEDRIMKPITHQEADTLHKLTITVGKLKHRTALNESMEMFGCFMERVNEKSPELAQAISPIVEEYISDRASACILDLRPDNFNSLGLIPAEKPDLTETQLDLQDITEWADAGKPVIDVEQLRSIPEELVVPLESAAQSQPALQGDQPEVSKYTPEQIAQILREATPPKDPSIGLNGKINPDTFYARMPRPKTEEERQAYLLAEQAMYDAIYGPELTEKDPVIAAA